MVTDFAWSSDGTQMAVARMNVKNDVVLFKGLHRWSELDAWRAQRPAELRLH
jgi:hypothetical protein